MDPNIIIKRLSIIKYLYLQGVEQSYQAEIVAGYSILAFHDSVEMFLMLACEEKDAIKINKKMMMMDYIGALPEITMKESMKSLNECRISLKHHGQFPSKSDIEKHRQKVHSFFNTNCQILFGIDFESVSLVDLVSYDAARQYLLEAEKNLKEGCLYNSLVNSRLAFEYMLREFESSKKHWYHSIYKIGKRIDSSYQPLIRKVFDKNATGKDKWFKEITDTVTSLQNVMHITSIGLDYGKYALFDAATPKCNWLIDGSPVISGCEGYMQEYVSMSQELCEMCISFVIESAVKLQNSDFDTSKYLKHT